MNNSDISTQLIYTTAPIYGQLGDNRLSTGTGFIISIQQDDIYNIPLLITNYHVVKNSVRGFVELHCTGENNVPSKETVKIFFDDNVVKNNKLGSLDLVALPLAGAIDELIEKGKYPYYKSIDIRMIPDRKTIENLGAIEDITFIGYPNDFYDKSNKLPVVRRGITATPIWNNFEDKEAFIIDASVFEGSSGSPVFIYNNGAYPTQEGINVGTRVLLVGILSETLQKKDTKDYLDLGYVINSSALRRELNRFIERITNRIPE